MRTDLAALLERAVALGTIDAWVIWKLSGGSVHATDRSQAWPMGYLDLASLGWNEEELIQAAVKQMRELPYYHGFTHKSAMPMIDLAARICTAAPCPAVVDNMIVYRDYHHLTATFSRSLGSDSQAGSVSKPL